MPKWKAGRNPLFLQKISALNAAVAVKSAKSAYAESCDKKRAR